MSDQRREEREREKAGEKNSARESSRQPLPIALLAAHPQAHPHPLSLSPELKHKRQWHVSKGAGTANCSWLFSIAGVPRLLLAAFSFSRSGSAPAAAPARFLCRLVRRLLRLLSSSACRAPPGSSATLLLARSHSFFARVRCARARLSIVHRPSRMAEGGGAPLKRIVCVEMLGRIENAA